ncbi:Uncharacterised protein [uncultured archaeon]|nr:Uncharacterised protein [uncultured archaeon]
MQPLDQLLGERLLLPGPFLDAQEGVPVVAHFGDVPLPAGDLRPIVGYYRPGLLQSETVSLDEGGVVCRLHSGAGAKLGFSSRREGRVVH